MKESFIKTGNTQKSTIVDKETGEVISETFIKHTYIANSKEQFFIGYVKLLAAFKDLSGSAIKVYAYLLMNYSPGIMIGINKAVKEDMKRYFEFKGNTLSTVDNALVELRRENLLYRESAGGYYINPRYAFKGSTSNRDKSLKTLIELGYQV